MQVRSKLEYYILKALISHSLFLFKAVEDTLGVEAKVFAKIEDGDRLIRFFVFKLVYLFNEFTAVFLTFSSKYLDILGVNVNAIHDFNGIELVV